MNAVSLTSLLVPTYIQMLEALSRWLDKAEGDALPAARLASDMFPLATQVRFACVQAYEGVARLRSEPLPNILSALLIEGREAGEQPGTIGEAQARIAATLDFLKALAPGAPDTDPQAPLAHELPNGMIFDLTAEQYARDWALPQFYFHVMAAYAILRAAGVALGKVDYVAHMLPYLRPGTAPQ